MSQRTVIQIVDDLDNSPIPEGEGSTISFALDGKGYEIDLSTKNAERLRAALAEYIQAARAKGGRRAPRSGSPKSTHPKAASTPNASAVREWARSQRLDVPSRGRVPTSIVEAYEAAH